MCDPSVRQHSVTDWAFFVLSSRWATDSMTDIPIYVSQHAILWLKPRNLWQIDFSFLGIIHRRLARQVPVIELVCFFFSLASENRTTTAAWKGSHTSYDSLLKVTGTCSWRSGSFRRPGLGGTSEIILARFLCKENDDLRLYSLLKTSVRKIRQLSQRYPNGLYGLLTRRLDGWTLFPTCKSLLCDRGYAVTIDFFIQLIHK